MTETVLKNLVAWSVQVGLLAIAAALVARIVQIDVPAARYVWWRAVLVVCLALPVIQPWAPPALSAVEVPAPEGATASGIAPPASARGMAAPVQIRIRPTTGPRWPSIVAASLAAGALLRLGWLAAGLLRLRRIRRSAVAADACDAPDLLQLLLDAGAEVRQVASLRQPVTFGVRRPVVLLPAALRAMSPGVQRAVLAHELWHVRRHDWLWSFSEEVLRSIFWFHPAIHYLVAQVQGAREEVVDRRSVLSTNAKRSYLEALLAFAEEPAVYPAAPFVRRRQLFNRMMLISKEGAMSSKRIVASSAAMAGVLIMTGWCGVQAFPLALSEAAGQQDAQRQAQAQPQPRDARPGTPRPATSREQALQTAVAVAPSNAKTWLELAKLQEERGALAEAEATLQAAFAATSGEREVLLSHARFLVRNGQFDKAAEMLETAAAQNPGDPAGYQLLASYYHEKAQKDVSLPPSDKLMYIESGIRATDSALAQRADYVEALTYKNILLRMKANLETDAARRQQLIDEANLLRGRAMELAKQRPAGRTGSDPSAPPPPPPPPPPPQDYQIDGQQAVRIGGEIPTPKKLRDVRPVYPPEAQDAGVTGLVIIEVVIDTQGEVRSSRVLRSIPQLDAAALDAVNQWRFTPTVRDGVAVPVVMTVTVNFTLQ
jgi:TonB family protein